MGQVSKEGLKVLQVESWDAIQATIYGKEDHPGMGIGRSGERK